MSRSPFAARFMALVGQSPMSYLKRWRLQLAAQLLQDQKLSLSEIAERVGYESSAALSRVFKREFGLSPAQYRRKGVVGIPMVYVEPRKQVLSDAGGRKRKKEQVKAASRGAN